jgi:caffeoyl-CoA O-methyltransferase
VATRRPRRTARGTLPPEPVGARGAFPFVAADAPLGALAAYAEAHTAPTPALLDRLAAETLAGAERPIMLSGRTVGRLLTILAGVLRPKLAVDVGTFTGYSALSIAEGLPRGARVVTCEADAATAGVAGRYFAASPHRAKIDLRVGPALATLRRLRGTIGLAFIDADKESYIDYYEAIVPRLAPEGLVVVDNTLMFATVVLDDAAAAALPPVIQRHRAAIRAFNAHVLADPRTEQTVLTVRDGVTIIRKLRARASRR